VNLKGQLDTDFLWQLFSLTLMTLKRTTTPLVMWLAMLWYKKTAEIIKNSIRTVDIAGRFGGEEFVIILPGTDEEGAIAVAERIRRAIYNILFLIGK